MWQQLAMLAGDKPASESVRVLLTAHDDPELARCVTADMQSHCRRAATAVQREDPSMARRIAKDENRANPTPRSAELTAMAACWRDCSAETEDHLGDDA